MSLLGSRLGAAIWTAVKAQESYSPAISGPQDAAGLALWTAIATQIVTEITSNAQVEPGTFTTPSGGDVTGEGTVT